MLNTSLIIENIKKDEFIEYKLLCKKLKISRKSDKEKLNIALDALEKLEIIKKNNKNEFENIKDNNHFTAKIRCSSKGYCFAVREDFTEDIYIKENLLNYAWNGDKVLVRIIKEGIRRRSPEGIVDCILERENKILLAKVELINNSVYGIPIDDRILAKVKLPANDKKYIFNSDKKNIVKIQIDMFPIAQEEGTGHVIKELKLQQNGSNDNEFVLSKNNLNTNNRKIKIDLIEPEIEERLDLTSKNSFMFKSWEHKSCPLLPLIQVEKFKDKTSRLWIHSNTISERIDFTKKNLLEYFKDNYESFPLIDSWQNFLDEKILNLSKFNVNKINKAISLCISLNKDKEIIDWTFHLTNVKCSTIIDNKYLEALYKRKSKLTTKLLNPIEDYIEEIKFIIELSKKFRSNQIKQGKYEITKENNNISKLDEFYLHKPGVYSNDYLEALELNDPQSMISPLLYEADYIWYKHSREFNIKNVFYNSNNLNYLNVNELTKHFQLNDNNIELNEEGNLTLDSLYKMCNDDNQKRIINKYLKSNFRNNLPKIHLNEEKQNNISIAPWTMPSLDFLNLINQYSIFLMFKCAYKSRNKAKNLNILKKNGWENFKGNLFNSNMMKISNLLFETSMIEKYNSFRLKTNSYLSNMISINKIREVEKLIGNKFHGLIITVQSYGFFVELPNILIEGLVHVSTLNDDWYEYRSRQNILVGRKSKNTYRVGDLIEIKIVKVDILKYQIDLEIIN